MGPRMKPTPQTAMASPRCWKGKISQRMACESGMIGPPPRPWKIRAMISVVRSGAAPDRNELTTNSVVQIRKNFLRPNRPTSHPVAGMTTALAARYDVITHDTSSSPAESEPCRCGSTTLVTLVSRICMKATTITDRVMAHLRAAEIGPVSVKVDALTRASRRLLHADDDVRGHAGPERVRVAELLGVQPDLHRDPLDDLDPVAGGVLGRQEREARAGARREGVHGAVED